MEKLSYSNTYVLYKNEIDFTLRLDVKYRLEKFRFLDKIFSSCDSLKKFTTFCDRGNLPEYGSNTNYHVVKSKDVNWQFTTEDDLSEIQQNSFMNSQEIQLKENDVLINGTGDGTACRPSIWLSKSIKAIVDGHVTIVRTNEELNPKYLFVFLRSRYGYPQLERQVIGSTGQLELYPNHILQLKIPIISKIVPKIESLVIESYKLYKDSLNKSQQAQLLFKNKIKIASLDLQKSAIKWKAEIDIIDNIDAVLHTTDLMNNSVYDDGFELLSKIADPKKGKSPPHSGYGTNDHRILKTKNLTNKGIDWFEIKNGYVPNSFFQDNLDAKIELDDIITSCDAHMDYFIGKNIDIVDEIPPSYQNGILSEQHTIIIRPRKTVHPYLLLMFLRSQLGYNLIQQKVRGTGQLIEKDLGEIPIPKKVIVSDIGNELKSLIKSSVKKYRESESKLNEATSILEKAITEKFS